MKKLTTLGYIVFVALAAIAFTAPALAASNTVVNSVTMPKLTAPPSGACNVFGVKRPAGSNATIYFDGTAIKWSSDCITWSNFGGGGVSLSVANTWTAPQTFADVIGRLVGGGTTPTSTGCGAGASIVGTDSAGQVNTGASAGNCQVTFTRAFSHAPVCFVINVDTHDITSGASGTTVMQISATADSATSYTYACIGY